MSQVITVDDSNFKSIVLESSVPVLVEFGATWCAPCKRQLPILNELAQEMKESIKIVKIDIDEAAEETKYYGVTSVPTLLLFENGEVTNSKTGLTNLNNLKLFLNKKPLT